MSLVLRQNLDRVLSIYEMDGNFQYLESLSLSQSIIPIDNSTALSMIASASVAAGASYVIQNAHPRLYGTLSNFTYGLQGTNIILKGLDSTNFSSNGWGQFYNPNYASYSMWNTDDEYSIDDKVIFGGQVWINTTGNTGHTLSDGFDSSSYISLDPEDWSVQGYTSSDYINTWDEVEYDLVDDFITTRYEAFNNNYVNNASKTFWFYCEINPIQSFKWGTTIGDLNNNVTNCKVIDSYFGSLNYISGNIANVELSGFSWIYDINLKEGSSLSYIRLSNNSGMNSFVMIDAYISNLTLDNNSYLYDFEMDSNSNIEYVTIKNDSYIDSFELNSNTELRYIEISNESYIENFTLHNSGCSIETINLTNNSSINNFNLHTGSYLEEINLSNNSNINNFELSDGEYEDGSYLSNIEIINNSSINNIYLYNRSYFTGITIRNNSTIQGVYLCSNSGTDCYISNLEISNSSHLWDDDDTIYLDDSSYMDRIKIDLYSAITLISMSGNSENEIYIRDIIVSNRSLIDNIIISGSVSLAYFSSITLVDSNAQDIVLSDSYIDYIDISDGSIDSLNLNNDSYISDVKINGGGISQYNLIVESSDSIYLDNSYMQFITLEQSIISGYISMTDSSYMVDLHLSNLSTIVGGFREDGDSVNDIGEYNYFIGLTHSYLFDISLDNNSIFGLGNITLNNSAMNNLSLDNNSRVAGYILLDSATMSNFKLENNSYFGRGNSISDDNSDSIQLNSNSTIQHLFMTNNAIIDGFIYLTNSNIIDVTLSGTPDANDSSSPGSANNYDIDNETGIVFGGGMELYDSYLQDIEITNGAYMTGIWGNEIYLENNSYMQGIKADNGSIINDVFLNGSFMKEIEVLNGSYIYNIDLEDGSSITYLSVSNYSYFGDYIYLSTNSYMTFIKIDNNSQLFGEDYGWDDIYLYDNSYLENITIKNNSSISSLNFDNEGSSGGSYFRNIEISNNSYLANIHPYNNSYFDTVIVSNNSGLDSIYLCEDSGSSAYMYSITVNNNSFITDDDDNIYIEDGGYMSNVYLNNYGYLSGYLEMYGGSYIYDIKIENDSYFGYNLNMEDGSHISWISLENDSYIEGDFSLVSSYLEYITMKNNSYISGNIEIFGAYINNLDLMNNSRIYNLSITDAAIIYNKFSNNSIMVGNTLDSGSSIGYNTIDDDSRIQGNVLSGGSDIEWILLRDATIDANIMYDSGIYDSILNDSSINNLSMTNSYIGDAQIFGSSNINHLDMNNNSSIVNVTLNSSSINNLSTDSSIINNIELNDSDIFNSNINDSSIFGSSLKSSNMYNLTLTGGGLEFVYMRDANILNLVNDNWITNLDMIGSTFDFNNEPSYEIPLYTRFDTNTIKYQFSKTFDGTKNNGQIGAVTIPKMLIPWNGTGWYIEKVIIDNNNTNAALVFAGTYSYINIGNTVDSDSGLDNTKGSISSMTSRITVSDISNGGADGTKTNAIGNIVMNIEGNNVMAGEIYVEIILKNTNYGTNND